ncbi:MAG TPA: hypothetical protein VGQ06_07400 [Gemmatimonadales bacterium]|jgi:hypothetical protein|nr:hypothetical protein [Gemmatimonadales bacterium]
MTHPAARLALCLGSLAAVVPGPAAAQVFRVVAGGREVARVEASTLYGYSALPVTLLARLGADVQASRAEVVVRLFGDTVRFRPAYAGFEVNGRTESLHSWTYLDENEVLFVAQWFFTHWLPSRYPERLAYRDGVLRIAVAPQPVAAPLAPSGDTARPVVTVGPARGNVPIPAPSPPRRDPDDPVPGVLLGFIDARVSGVFDSNIDRDPVPRPSYGTVARLGIGLQSARSRPFLTARYDFSLYRFANTEEWNRTTHDVTAELAPSRRPLRLRLAATLRIGSWTEDREPANQIILKPQIEFRPAPAHVFSLYVVHSARRIDIGVGSRRDTFQLAAMGYYLWWHGGGLWVDGRYEVNKSEFERSRYVGWTGSAWIRIPLPASHRVTLETAYNRRWYARSFVDQAGTVARADRRWTSSVSLSREFEGRPWEVGLKYGFEDNRSNDTYAVYQARRVEVTVRRRW